MSPPSKPNEKNESTRIVTLAELGERGWLRLVREWFSKTADESGARIAVPIGDDAAALDLGGARGPLIVSTDALIEGVHFRHAWTRPHDLGAKALAVNLSDLAAMGAKPLAAFLALGVPPETPLRALKEFFMGLREEGRAHGCPLAGGDLTRAPQWTICLTVLGTPAVAGRVARRSTATPGQLIYVTGRPGEAGAGLEALERGVRAPALIERHNRPTPRLQEAAALSRLCPDLAMLDVSDGLWNDADQLAEASGVAIELCLEALPVSPAMARLGRRLGRDPLEWTLFGGEDYELLFATRAHEEAIERAFEHAGFSTPVHLIGHVSAGRGVHLKDCDCNELEIPDRTFRHF